MNKYLPGYKGQPILLPKAGGEAAYSAFAHLRDLGVAINDIVAADDNEATLEWWRGQGCLTMPYKLLEDEPLGLYYPIPTDEDLMIRWPLVNHLASGASEAMVDKIRSYEMVEAYCESPSSFRPLAVPNRLVGAVSREARSSGGKGTKVYPDHDYLVTEFLNFDAEYVIDFHLNRGLVFPRITHCLRHGADTYVTLLGREAPEYADLYVITVDLCSLFGYSGVGNLQLGRVGSKFYFIEIAPRFSGASWVNLPIGNHLLKSEEAKLDFHKMPMHTNAATRL